MSSNTGLPIFLLTGEDSWQQRKFLQSLIEKHLEAEWRDFNLEIFSADTDPNSLLESWLTRPLWGSCRIIQVDFQHTPEALYQCLSVLNSYLASHTPETPNLFIMITENVDKRRKEVKQILSQITVQDFPVIKPWNIERDLYPWIEEQLRQAGKRVTRPALQYLASALGTDKHALHQTLEKLLIYLGDEPQLEESHVKALVTQTEADIFSLLELLARRKEEQAQIHLRHQLLRESPENLFASLAANLRILYRARYLQAQRWNLDEIARELNQHSFRLKKNLELWQDFSLPELESKLRRLLDLHTRMRQGFRLDPVLALEIWIHEFTRPSPRKTPHL